MSGEDRYYSELGRSYQPGAINQVAFAALELKKQGKRLISLAGGLYDPDSVPYEAVKEILSEASPEDWSDILQYGNTMGSPELREALSQFMAGHGVEANPESEILVTSGSQQALDVVSKTFIDPGDVLLVGSPTYLQALSAFRQFNPEFRTIPVDDRGMNTDALEETLNGLSSEGKRAKLLYVIPSFQNPTSTVLSQGRRRRMLELAEEHDLLIVEDNPYGYISFDGPMPTPLKAMDDGGRVLYTSTFSKIVSPGLRIGWLAAREDFVEKMTEAKNNVNISNDGLSTYVATEFLERGLVERQIPKMTRVYREKRDVMLEAMVDSFPEKARWNDPKGGLFLWAEMPGHVDTTGMMMDAVRKGVAYVPGSNFFVDTSIRNYIRLNYSFPSLDDIREGIGILGGLLREKV